MVDNRINDLTGRRFGKLLVLSLAGRRRQPNGNLYLVWNVRCDCGAEKQVKSASLVHGYTKSCGCLRLEILRRLKGSKLQPGESQRNEFLGRYKKSAADRGLSWELTKQDFLTLISSTCHYCAALPAVRPLRKHRFGQLIANGIDRKDNTIGYILSNALPCCETCNRAKSDMTYEQFLGYLSRVCSFRAKPSVLPSTISS